MSALAALDLHRVRFSRPHPFAAAHGTEDDREVVVVRAVLDDGTSGWGECPTLARPTYTAEYTAGAWSLLHDLVAPAVVAGRDHGVVGHPMALGAVADALLDADLRCAGSALATSLGATATRVPSTAVEGRAAGVDELLARVAADLEAGHRSVTCKIGPGWDLEPLGAVRSAWPDLALSADANGSYGRGDVDHLAGLDPLDLDFLEQPLPADDLVGSSLLARRLDTPIALDESLSSVAAAGNALALRAGSVLNVKPARLGGVRPAAALAFLAAELELPAFVGGMLESGVGRAAGLAVAALPACTLPTALGPSSRYVAGGDLTPPFELDADGCLAVPLGLGIGVEPDPARLAATTVAHARFEP